MTAPKREYSRLYHDLVDDPMFAGIYDDDALFGAWSKLLMLADASWPQSAPLPAGISKGRLSKLVAAGLVDVAGARFRIRGMDKERSARSDRGRRGADGRWHGPADDGHSEPGAAVDDDGMPPHPPSNAGAMRPHPVGNAEGMPSKDEQSKAEQSRDEQSRSARDLWGLCLHVENLIGRWAAGTNSWAHRTLSEDFEALGYDRVEAAMDSVHREQGDTPMDETTFISEVHKHLYPFAKKPDPKAREDAEADAARQRHEKAVAATAARIRELETVKPVDPEVAARAMAATKAAIGG